MTFGDENWGRRGGNPRGSAHRQEMHENSSRSQALAFSVAAAFLLKLHMFWFYYFRSHYVGLFEFYRRGHKRDLQKL